MHSFKHTHDHEGQRCGMCVWYVPNAQLQYIKWANPVTRVFKQMWSQHVQMLLMHVWNGLKMLNMLNNTTAKTLAFNIFTMSMFECWHYHLALGTTADVQQVSQYACLQHLPTSQQPESTDVVRTDAGTVRTGLEFKGLRRAGAALIFGRGVKALTFTLHSTLYPWTSSKKGRVQTACRGEIPIVHAAYIIVTLRVHVCVSEVRAVYKCMMTCYICEDKWWKENRIYIVYMVWFSHSPALSVGLLESIYQSIWVWLAWVIVN